MNHSGACLIKKKHFLFKYTSNSTKRRVKTKFKINKEAVGLRKYGNHFNGKRLCKKSGLQ